MTPRRAAFAAALLFAACGEDVELLPPAPDASSRDLAVADESDDDEDESHARAAAAERR